LSPEGAYLIGELSVNVLIKEKLKVYATGGMTLGADPLATAVSLAAYRRGLTIPAFIVRKQPKGHGTLAWVEGAKSFPKGADLLLLEDVVTTGGSSLTAAEKLEESGFKVKNLITVVDREEGGASAIEKKNIAFFSLCTLSEIRNA
jgi:orotate phosphoribosyltransferase